MTNHLPTEGIEAIEAFMDRFVASQQTCSKEDIKAIEAICALVENHKKELSLNEDMPKPIGSLVDICEIEHIFEAIEESFSDEAMLPLRQLLTEHKAEKAKNKEAGELCVKQQEEIDNLEGSLETALKANDRLGVMLADTEKSVEAYKRMLAGHMGEYWVWQNDGNDNVESIGCAILVHPEDMRKIQAGLETAKKEHVEMMAENQALRKIKSSQAEELEALRGKCKELQQAADLIFKLGQEKIQSLQQQNAALTRALREYAFEGAGRVCRCCSCIAGCHTAVCEIGIVLTPTKTSPHAEKALQLPTKLPPLADNALKSDMGKEEGSNLREEAVSHVDNKKAAWLAKIEAACRDDHMDNLLKIIITDDGRGKEWKQAAFKELLKRNTDLNTSLVGDICGHIFDEKRSIEDSGLTPP